MSGLSRAKACMLDTPLIMGASITVSMPASRAMPICAAKLVEIAREARHIARLVAARAQGRGDRRHALGEG